MTDFDDAMDGIPEGEMRAAVLTPRQRKDWRREAEWASTHSPDFTAVRQAERVLVLLDALDAMERGLDAVATILAPYHSRPELSVVPSTTTADPEWAALAEGSDT